MATAKRPNIEVTDEARANIKSLAALSRMPMKKYIEWLAQHAITNDIRPKPTDQTSDQTANATKPDASDASASDQGRE